MPTPTTRVLKGAAPLPARRVPAVVHAADRQVRDMIAAAEADAARIRGDAEAAAERTRAAAEAEGRREGLARAAATLASAADARARRLAAAEAEVVALVFAVARKVLDQELAARPEVVIGLAARALEEARERRDVVLRVHADDADRVADARSELARILARAPLAVRVDPGVERGGAVVETEWGRVDASVGAQLAALARAVEEGS